MYFVDREKIEKTLLFYEENLQLIEANSNWTSVVEKKALERISHLTIEAILDVGNSMIDGFIMRDPGSYEDIIDILEDEKVVTTEVANELKEIIRFRKVIVQDYLEINHDELISSFQKNKESLASFPQAVRSYLENELGPVSAFKN
ncbi:MULTISPECIES: type VII toxin-antitoxin system HepT family RNase toxin [unclassified Fredinandcohnia]|uniref:type VII toxin-antitoxin system HepT family RNase toxin n=1 Tax=unclassified Fredinandcohnia TaxID=2837514 RepID=UPI0030FDF06C